MRSGGSLLYSLETSQQFTFRSAVVGFRRGCRATDNPTNPDQKKAAYKNREKRRLRRFPYISQPVQDWFKQHRANSKVLHQLSD